MKGVQHTILCVDDEKNILHSLRRLLRKEGYNLLTATDAFKGLEILKEEKVDLVICDQRMPDMGGTEFLAKVKEEYPDIVRVILTGYTDVDSITESVNKGHIYKFLLKPWNDLNLKQEINQCLEQYELLQTNKNLQERIIKQNDELKDINENLENIVKERTSDLVIKNRALDISRAILEDLPIPVIALSSDLMIVMVNIIALRLSVNEKHFETGKNITEYFAESLKRTIEKVIETDEAETVKGINISGKMYDIDISSASGKFRGKGAVLAFIPVRT